MTTGYFDKTPRPGLVAIVAALIALAIARPHAGGWNDGSRFAAAESLVERHTWVIDDSPFVHPGRGGTPNPYVRPDASYDHGTYDKLFIDGHYYSDKSPLPTLYLAGVYAALKPLGLSAASRPGAFCYVLTVFSSGLAYVLGLVFAAKMFERLKLPPRDSWLLLFTLAVGTMAFCYTEYVNQHILLLGTFMPLFYLLTPGEGRGYSAKTMLAAGALVGLSYATDLGIGPVLVVSTGLLVLYRSRRWKAAVLLAAGALPFMLANHYFNYRVGHTFKPANANVAYLLWPGSPFNAKNATGGWAHPSVQSFVRYMFDLLVGKTGFIPFNLPAVIALAHFQVLLRKTPRLRERPEVVYAIALSLGVYLMYGSTSNNHSGACISIRWFLPLLAPAYFTLALLLRERPEFVRPQALALAPFAAAMGLSAAWVGPWWGHLPPFFWVIYVGGLMAWTVSTYAGVASPRAAAASD